MQLRSGKVLNQNPAKKAAAPSRNLVQPSSQPIIGFKKAITIPVSANVHVPHEVQDWDGEGGRATSYVAYTNAVEFIEFSLQNALPAPVCFPTHEGEIDIMFSKSGVVVTSTNRGNILPYWGVWPGFPATEWQTVVQQIKEKLAAERTFITFNFSDRIWFNTN